MDPVTTSTAIGALDKLSAQHGFNALLILILIAAMVVIIRAFLVFLREERVASTAERKEAREAHVGALREVTGELKELRRDVAGGGRVYARPD